MTQPLARPAESITRVAFLGTPDVAVPTLRAIHAAGFEIPIVITRPDRRRGRGGALSPSPVKQTALDLGLEVSDDLAALDNVSVDIAVVVAYGRIIPVAFLQRIPMVNLHFSLLPRWRGAAPVERAILAGDRTTGVCLMQVAEGLDTGDIYDVVSMEITPDDTLDSLRMRLVEAGSAMVVRCLSKGLPEPRPQIGEPVHAAKIAPAELELDWDEPAVQLSRVVRLGGAWTIFREKRLKIWAVNLVDRHDLAPGVLDGVVIGTSAGAVELVEVQPEGRARIAADAWRNGAQPHMGERVGS